jgi:hypothetical protein
VFDVVFGGDGSAIARGLQLVVCVSFSGHRDK